MSTETLKQHEKQQEKHVEDHEREEKHTEKEHEYREDHGMHDYIGREIAHEERAERRQQDETNAALTETADTILREG
ncbi:hypothetical protein VJ923_03145 [Adlercreutzia sp. R25]|uniref:Uncharacterized protein n=1 Tax=Adlercreutzia shanghongiae TaxID=3111773 RepID=A0ABU6IVQ2_9ACTN|nr:MULTISPECIES: hypothetical protein [unclassified Adlercreutzia]MEC4272154.1 hypothetical protein [Adlercreutzia sp. R25]MEC4293875.1 hypothetical protein [Adlercreutzia sp. R22]